MGADACKALIVVQAGVIPGVRDPKLTMTWSYGAEAAARDADGAIFRQKLEEAYAYALRISDPRRVNWVQTNFMWM